MLQSPKLNFFTLLIQKLLEHSLVVLHSRNWHKIYLEM